MQTELNDNRSLNCHTDWPQMQPTTKRKQRQSAHRSQSVMSACHRLNENNLLRIQVAIQAKRLINETRLGVKHKREPKQNARTRTFVPYVVPPSTHTDTRKHRNSQTRSIVQGKTKHLPSSRQTVCAHLQSQWKPKECHKQQETKVSH